MYIPSGHMQECPLLGRPIHKNGQTGVLELVAQALVPWRKLCEKICKTRGEKKNIVKLDRKRWRHWWIDTLRSMTPGSRLAMVNSPVPRFLSAIKIPCAFHSVLFFSFYPYCWYLYGWLQSLPEHRQQSTWGMQKKRKEKRKTFNEKFIQIVADPIEWHAFNALKLGFNQTKAPDFVLHESAQ